MQGGREEDGLSDCWRIRKRSFSSSIFISAKFYLHIGKDEQEQRLLEREKDPIKAWKLSVNDWKEREHWDDFTAAYEDALNRCSTEHAPWFIVPADKKWFRNLAVAEALRDALPFRETWQDQLLELGREEKKAIAKYRRALSNNK